MSLKHYYKIALLDREQLFYPPYSKLFRILITGINRKQVGIEIDCERLKGPNTTFWKIIKDNKIIGKITSAVYSPRLKKNIALAMVLVEQSEIGNKLQVITNEGSFNSTIVEKPFYDPKKKIANI